MRLRYLLYDTIDYFMLGWSQDTFWKTSGNMDMITYKKTTTSRGYHQLIVEDGTRVLSPCDSESKNREEMPLKPLQKSLCFSLSLMKRNEQYVYAVHMSYIVFAVSQYIQ